MRTESGWGKLALRVCLSKHKVQDTGLAHSTSENRLLSRHQSQKEEVPRYFY